MAELISSLYASPNAVSEAIAGSSEIIFTAADRKIIKDRIGDIDNNKNFTELVKGLFSKTKTIDKVETDEKRKVENTDLKTWVKIENKLIKTTKYPEQKQKEEKETPHQIDPKEYEKRQKELNMAKEEFKKAYIDMLLCENPYERYSRLAGATALKSNLEKLSVTSQEINNLIFEAKKTAWLSLVVDLKGLHLKRVFSSTKKEFEETTEKIRSDTLRARKLGLKINPEGVKLVEAKLEKMAYDAAHYKLDLYKSMQKMAHDPAREKDILWLERIIGHLKNLSS